MNLALGILSVHVINDHGDGGDNGDADVVNLLLHVHVLLLL